MENETKEINKSSLVNDLRTLGVKKGDVVLIRANLINVLINRKKNSLGKTKITGDDFIQAVLETVGPKGTVIGLSFTKLCIFPNKNDPFTLNSVPYTGSFAKLMLDHPKSVRSSHPSNSFVCIGPHSKEIIKNHNAESGAFEPIRKIMELNGKMLLVGCTKESPGFTTTHLAEVDLGYHKKFIFSKIFKTYYIENNRLHLFKRKDGGSCGSTLSRFYQHYISSEILMQGFVGNAYSLLVNASQCYSVDYKVLKENPRIGICSNPNCFKCNVNRWENLYRAPNYLIRKILKLAKKKFNF